jgi:hypothetical protein
MQIVREGIVVNTTHLIYETVPCHLYCTEFDTSSGVRLSKVVPIGIKSSGIAVT